MIGSCILAGKTTVRKRTGTYEICEKYTKYPKQNVCCNICEASLVSSPRYFTERCNKYLHIFADNNADNKFHLIYNVRAYNTSVPIALSRLHLRETRNCSNTRCLFLSGIARFRRNNVTRIAFPAFQHASPR